MSGRGLCKCCISLSSGRWNTQVNDQSEVVLTVSNNTRKCVAYIKVCYIPKDRNTREYFSPDFVKMDFQRSLVQYRLPKLTCYSCSL